LDWEWAFSRLCRHSDRTFMADL